jgi:hypothetical protein
MDFAKLFRQAYNAGTMQTMISIDTPADDQSPSDLVGPHTVNPPDNVPKEVRDFIRLQNEIAGRETGELIYMLSAEAIEDHYLNSDAPLKKMKKKDKRDYMKRFMEQMEAFINAICHTYGKAIEVKELHHRVKTHMVAVLESMDEKTAAKMLPHVERYNAELAEAKENVSIYKRILRDMRNPDHARVQEINQELEAESEKIANIQRRFQNRVEQVTTPAAAETTATATAEPSMSSASHAPDMHSAMDNAAKNPKAHYRAPVSDSMPAHFSGSAEQSGKPGKPKPAPQAPAQKPAEDLTDS